MMNCNIAIIGGGAAGFFAAIAAKETNREANVTILEKTSKPLAKVAVSGGGRCNLTNSFAKINDLKTAYPRGNKLIKRLFNVFNHEDVFRWFEDRGVQLTTQSDECVFPRSQSSQSIINCLTSTANSLGVKVLTGHGVNALLPQDNGDIKVEFDSGKHMLFNRVLVTTGGASRAERLNYLADIGHVIVPPVPSLFTFNIADQTFRNLMGVVVDNAAVSIPGTKLRATGALLITHWGASGPAILKLSSYAARHVSDCNYRFPLSVNWVANANTTALHEQLLRIVADNAKKQLATVHPYSLTARLWQYLLSKTAIDQAKRWEELSRKEINKIVETLTNDHYEVTGKGTFRDEFVTCGGVSLSSINLNTLESKACPNLFFAGEVLDIDAITGGFNLQAAWTTGYVAGKEMANLKHQQ